MKKTAVPMMWQYVIYSYLLFWVMIIGLGGAASMIFQAPPAVMNAITVLCSWSPTIVLLLMLKKLRPGMTVGGFYKQAFKERLSIPLLVVTAMIVFGIFFSAVLLLSGVQGTAFSTQIAVPSALGGVILLTALQGPSGEESGWRGYLRLELEERFGFMKGNLVLGLIWTFWHTPLWFIASSFTGSHLLMYIASNVIVMTALTFMMGIFMKRCNNLFIPFWIHFCFNLSLRFFAGGIYFFAAISVLYTAAILVLLKYSSGKWIAPDSSVDGAADVLLDRM